MHGSENLKALMVINVIDLSTFFKAWITMFHSHKRINNFNLADHDP